MAKRRKPLIPDVPPLKKETQDLTKESPARPSFTHLVLRRYVATYLTVHSGMTAEEVVAHLRDTYSIDCTVHDVNGDLYAMRKRWLETANLDTAKLVERELTDLESMREMIAHLYATGETQAAIETNLKIQKRRAMLLGLDKPIKIELGVKRVESLTDAEIEAEAARMEERSRGRLIEAEPQGGIA